MDQDKIGKLIARLRKQKGLTQAQLGEMVGVGYRAVSKWETGQTMPDISIINELSTILGITSDELLTGELKSNDNNNTPHKSKKKISIIITLIILVLLITTVIYLTNKNITYTYDLYTKESDSYYVEGKIIFKKEYTNIVINKIGFINKYFSKTMIKNYEYEIKSNNTLLFSYGCLECHSYQDNPITIEEFTNNYTINTNYYIDINRYNIINNHIILRIKFYTEDDQQITKEIELLLKK